MKADKRRARFCPQLHPDPELRALGKQIARAFDVPMRFLGPPAGRMTRR